MKSQITETVTIAQASQSLRQAVRIYFSKDRQGHYCMERRRARPLCLMGPAGIGKTELVRQTAEENGLAFLSYSITHHTRQSIIGLPRLTDEEVEGKCCSVTEYTMSEIIAQIYRTMKETGKLEGILFLDEFNCASESLRPILLQLLQDKSFGPHQIPDGWMLVLAGNPSEYNRSSTDLDAVTADRIRLLHIKPDYPAWREYMMHRKVHPVVLSYLDNHRSHFYVYQNSAEGTALATARGWEDLSQMMQFLEREGEKPDLPLIAQYIQAADVARSFFAYYTQYAAIVSTGLIDQILKRDPKAVQSIQKMSFDRGWSLISALLRHVQTRAEQALELDTTTAGVHAQLKMIGQRRVNQPELELDSCLLEVAGSVEDKLVHHFLTDCVLVAQEDNGWEAVKERFDRELRQPRMELYENLAVWLENLIQVCRVAFEGKPHLEFLFNSLCESPAITDVLACAPNPEFRSLLQDVCFNPAAAERLLLRQLEKEEDVS